MMWEQLVVQMHGGVANQALQGGPGWMRRAGGLDESPVTSCTRLTMSSDSVLMATSPLQEEERVSVNILKRHALYCQRPTIPFCIR